MARGGTAGNPGELKIGAVHAVSDERVPRPVVGRRRPDDYAKGPARLNCCTLAGKRASCGPGAIQRCHVDVKATRRDRRGIPTRSVVDEPAQVEIGVRLVRVAEVV